MRPEAANQPKSTIEVCYDVQIFLKVIMQFYNFTNDKSFSNIIYIFGRHKSLCPVDVLRALMV